MDNVIKISSKQGAFDTSGGKSLVDFELAGGSGVYNFSESFINVSVNMTAQHSTNSNAVYNLFTQLQLDDASDDYVYPTSALVKNASLFSQTKGKIEDLRKVSSLRTNLSVYEQSSFEKSNSLGSITSVNVSKYFNIQPQNDLITLGTELSKNRDHDIRIPLKSIYNIGNNEAIDTGRLGNIKMHLEMHFDKMLVNQTEVTSEWNARRKFGLATNPFINATDNTNAVDVANKVVMTASWEDLESCPFWVGMPVILNGGYGANAGALTPIVNMSALTIKSIARGNDNKLTVIFDGNVIALPAGNALFNITVDYHDLLLSSSLVINSVELVAQVNSSDEAPSVIPYTTWISEEDSYPVQKTLNRYYSIEPASKTIMLVFSANGAVSRDVLDNYRLTLDGHDITPRAVSRVGSIHKDLVGKSMLNRGIRPHSIQEKIYKWDAGKTRGGNGGDSCFVISIPCPFVNKTQKLGVELEAVATLNGSHILYKEVLKQI